MPQGYPGNPANQPCKQTYQYLLHLVSQCPILVNGAPAPRSFRTSLKHGACKAMKCIKSTTDNEIRRLSDDEADKQVRSGRWEYVNKTAWKLYRLATELDINQGAQS